MALTVDETGNPIKVTGTTATSSEIVGAGELCRIRFVYWYNPTTVGHLCALQDSHGKTIIEMYCETANKSQIWPVMEAYDGVFSDDMDSGTLYIYRR